MTRRFTPEYPPGFRAEAVRLVREGVRQVSAAAKDLGVSLIRCATGSSRTRSTAANARTARLLTSAKSWSDCAARIVTCVRIARS
jgi:transposase-like protein